MTKKEEIRYVTLRNVFYHLTETGLDYKDGKSLVQGESQDFFLRALHYRINYY